MTILLVKNKFGKIWKDLVVASSAWGGEKSHEKYRQCNGSLSRTLKAGLPVYEAESLHTNFVTKYCCFLPRIISPPFVMDTQQLFCDGWNKVYVI